MTSNVTLLVFCCWRLFRSGSAGTEQTQCKHDKNCSEGYNKEILKRIKQKNGYRIQQAETDFHLEHSQCLDADLAMGSEHFGQVRLGGV
jgi:hypothetical protein